MLPTNALIARNTVSLLGARGLGLASQVVSTMILTRVLGSDRYGDYAVTFSYAWVVWQAVDGGAQLAAVRYGAQTSASQNSLALSSFFARLPILATGWVITLVIAYTVGNSSGVLAGVAMTAGLLPAASIVSCLSSVLYARLEAHRAAVLEATPWFIHIVLLAAAGWVGWLSTDQGTPVAIGALGAAYVAASLLGLAFNLHTAGGRLRLDTQLSRELLFHSTTLIPMALMSQLNVRGGLILTGVMRPGRTAAEYGLSLQLFEGVVLVSSAIMATFFPAFSRGKSIGHEIAFLRRALAICGIFCTLLAIGVVIMAEPIVFLLGGTGLQGAVPSVRVLTIAAWIGSLNSPLSYLLVSRRREHTVLMVQPLTVVINLALTAVLLRHLDSVGAALALLITSLLGFIIMTLLTYRLVSEARNWRH